MHIPLKDILFGDTPPPRLPYAGTVFDLNDVQTYVTLSSVVHDGNRRPEHGNATRLLLDVPSASPSDNVPIADPIPSDLNSSSEPEAEASTTPLEASTAPAAEEPVISQYEKIRMANIARNAAFLQSIGLGNTITQTATGGQV